MLRNLYTEFDKTCMQNNVYKLYTIGDCYVVFGIINSSNVIKLITFTFY